MTLAPGTRVRLRPRRRADVFDLALDGRTAVVDAIERDMEDRVHVVVTVDDDPGRDLAGLPQLGHRFFFGEDELEPLAAARVLVAGIGNVFLADDGWGVALAERLAERRLPPGAEVVDYGIRGMDLAYALGDGWDAVVLLDAMPRGGEPGTLYVIEPDVGGEAPGMDAHGMDPVQVLALARSLGGALPRVIVVGCEPGVLLAPDDERVVAQLSPPVEAALARGVEVVAELVDELLAKEER